MGKSKPQRKLSEYEKWISSDDGKGCVDGSTIGVPPRSQTYLENRLWRAFHAGMAAAQKPVKRRKA
jgi:hypothetical protein